MRRKNIHLTLYFIGNIPVEQFEEVTAGIAPCVQAQKKFTLEFDALCFAPGRKPRMIWMKYKKNFAFSSFAQTVHGALKRIIPANKFYFPEPVPHITLARFHSMKNYTDIQLTEPLSLAPLHIESCELWETIHAGGRSDYQSVRSFHFS